MSQVVTTTWTDANVIVAPTLVAAAGASVRGTIDLRTAKGAYCFAKIGRLATTVLANPINVYIRRVLNNGVVGTNIPFTHPLPAPQFTSQVAVTTAPTVGTDAAAAAKTLVTSSGTSIVAGDIICISDSGGTTFARTEFKVVNKVSTNTLTLAEGLDYAHTSAQADTVCRLADSFTPFWMPGGSLWEVIFDYGASATGGNVVVMAHAQVYSSDLVT